MAEVEALRAEQEDLRATAPSPVVRSATGAAVIEQPPTEGVSGHPFFTSAPDGRRTGVLGTGNDRVRLTFSGQINRSLNTVDDGRSTRTYHVDNENASTRFRFLGETAEYEGWRAVSLFEFEFMSNRSLVVNQTNQSGNEQISRRLFDIGVNNNNYGTITLGHGWMASDGTSELDISGITTSAWPSIHFGYGAMLFTDNNGLTGRTVLGAMDSLDGLSRRDRIRYDSPVIEGFQLSTSAAADDAYDVALRWGGTVPGARILVGGSYWRDNSDTPFGSKYDGWSASGTLRLEGNNAWYDGFSLVGSIAERNFDNRDNNPFYWYGKLAYTTNIWEVGRSGVALNYASYDEFAAVDEKGEMIGFGLSQNLDPLGIELYGNLNFLTLDSETTDYNDMWVLQTGMMVRF
jgi:predicted porin